MARLCKAFSLKIILIKVLSLNKILLLSWGIISLYLGELWQKLDHFNWSNTALDFQEMGWAELPRLSNQLHDLHCELLQEMVRNSPLWIIKQSNHRLPATWDRWGPGEWLAMTFNDWLNPWEFCWSTTNMEIQTIMRAWKSCSFSVYYGASHRNWARR